MKTPFQPQNLDVNCHDTSHDCSCCHLSHDPAVVCYDGSELAGRLTPRLCSRLEAGPASPAWQLRDSSRFVTRLRSKSSGWISSSACPEPPCVGGLFADRWGELWSKSACLELCREKVNISNIHTDGWMDASCMFTTNRINNMSQSRDWYVEDLLTKRGNKNNELFWEEKTCLPSHWSFVLF